MSKQFYLFLVFIISSITVFSQTALLKVKVLDENNNPLMNVNASYKLKVLKGEVSNLDGLIEIKIPANQEVQIMFSSVEVKTKYMTFNLTENEVKTIVLNLKPSAIYVAPIDVHGIKKQYRKEEQMMDIDVKQGALPSPSGDISTYLETQTFIHKNNELSTAYSVRGGNFDENLVYVNDFEIYRPFLIRSGQQEGLSFINPDMVDKIAFSAGGFQSKYGDKMASVLDVKYKRPIKFGGTFSASLLGVNAEVEGTDKSRNFTFALGARYKTSKLLLGALDVKGEYTPTFVDFQGFFTYYTSQKFHFEYISNFALNKFDFIPEDRTTDFGLVNYQRRFQVYYDNGSAENDSYNSLMNGLAAVFEPQKNIELKFLLSSYNMTEKESFDLLGEYFLGDVETDPAKENVGEVTNILGSGAFHDWARNKLYTDVYSLAHKGKFEVKKHLINWGLTYKHERIEDRINEWVRVDSSGYNIPYNGNEINFYKVLKPKPFVLQSNRYSGYLQDTWVIGDTSRLEINYGARFQYWDINKKFIITPRVQLRYIPSVKGHFELKAAAGMYYQQPFYREMKNLKGDINLNLKPQKSAHFILGADYSFKAWKRDFRFITEVYYKYLWDNVPYKYDNVLIRYYGTNNSKGYVAGVDLRLNGELADGVESWISLSLMSAEEDILDDHYTAYEIKKTKNIEYGVVVSDITDTVSIKEVYPGYIAKPSDQRVRFALFFQDYIPKFPYVKVHLNLVLASGLPFGPPNSERYKDVYRMTDYKRFDIGFSASLFNKKLRLEKNKKVGKVFANLESIWVSFEVFNIFAIKNVASYSWVDAYDVRTQSLGQYAVPNYLTDRRFNVKLKVDF